MSKLVAVTALFFYVFLAADLLPRYTHEHSQAFSGKNRIKALLDTFLSTKHSSVRGDILSVRYTLTEKIT